MIPGLRGVRKPACAQNRSWETYRTYFGEGSPEVAANTLLCLIHQANYRLDQQLRQLKQQFVNEGGFTERLFRVRQQHRASGNPPADG